MWRKKLPKKYIIFLILLIGLITCASCFVFANNKQQDHIIELDFSSKKDSNSKDIGIVWNYILNELEVSSSIDAKEKYNVEKENIITKSVDLNDDRQNEILYIVYSSYYWGTAGYTLGILEKTGNNYRDITYIINFEPQNPVYILNKKINGYKLIKLWGSSAENYEKTLKYNKKNKHYYETQKD